MNSDQIVEYPEYSVYAIRYGSHPMRSSSENFLFPRASTAHQPLDFYFWVIVGDGRVIVVDTGFSAAAARRRNKYHIQSPVAALSSIGIDPKQVADLIITHLHYDHIGNLDCFPNSRFHIQRSEIPPDINIGRTAFAHDHAYEPDDIALVLDAVRTGRSILYDGHGQVAPGVTLHHVGGHTPGLQVVRISTKRGWVVLASDAAHYWANIRERNPFPLQFNESRTVESYQIIETLADGEDHIIPGHDPMITSCFPSLPGNRNILLLHEYVMRASPVYGMVADSGYSP